MEMGAAIQVQAENKDSLDENCCQAESNIYDAYHHTHRVSATENVDNRGAVHLEPMLEDHNVLLNAIFLHHTSILEVDAFLLEMNCCPCFVGFFAPGSHYFGVARKAV